MTVIPPACATCGIPLPPNARFCPGCAAPVSGDTAVEDGPKTGALTSAAGRQAGAAAFQAGDQVGTRYTIIKLLGEGGMGAVYQAFDHELGVGVAIKVIRPPAHGNEKAAAELEQRFKRELVLARQITHKHVVRIHDIGEIDGIKYLTMPFVEGETLAEVLQRDGTVPIARTIALATQMARGLAAAHDKGIVHRDLKPENIMIEQDSGDALIMDFGIARSIEQGSTQTAKGAVMGTVPYMAPEQAQGRPLDHRADLYALGLIIYDMLIGRQRLASSEGPMAELLARIQAPPRAPRQINPAIPEAIDALVMRCLQPSPDARYQTTAELAAALERLTPEGHMRLATTMQMPAVRRRSWWPIAAAAALIAIAAPAGWLLSTRTGRERVPPATISVLVAQFDNKTGDPVFDGVLEQALGLGLEGATFITSYSQRDALRSAAAIKRTTLDESTARLVAVRDGVTLVLAGTLAQNGSAYAIDVKAIDAVQGTTVVSASATASDKTRLLTAVGDLATRIRRELGDTAADEAKSRGETFTAASIEAARAYVVAQELAQASKFNEAIAQYQEAVQRDPNFGRAYSGWANAAYRAGRPDEAAELWKKSLTLIDRMTEREKYRTLGNYYLGPGANDEQAVENYKMLVANYPSDSTGLNNLAVAYFRVLDFKRAAEQGLKAAQVYPKNLTSRTNVALYAMYASDLPTAVTEAKAAIAIAPFDKAYLPIAMAALNDGRVDDALAAYAEMAKASTRGSSIASMGRADVAMYQGRYDDARQELQTGAAADEAGNLRLPRALKLIALAEVAAATRGDVRPPVEQAMALASADAVTVPAGRLLAMARHADAAGTIAAILGKHSSKRSRALSAVVRAEIALAANRPADAIEVLQPALLMADLWLVRWTLGRAYLEGGRHAEALAEFDACQKRIGEASDVFLDDWPTFRYTATLKELMARARTAGGAPADSRKRTLQ